MDATDVDAEPYRQRRGIIERRHPVQPAAVDAEPHRTELAAALDAELPSASRVHDLLASPANPPT